MRHEYHCQKVNCAMEYSGRRSYAVDDPRSSGIASPALGEAGLECWGFKVGWCPESDFGLAGGVGCPVSGTGRRGGGASLAVAVACGPGEPARGISANLGSECMLRGAIGMLIGDMVASGARASGFVVVSEAEAGGGGGGVRVRGRGRGLALSTWVRFVPRGGLVSSCSTDRFWGVIDASGVAWTASVACSLRSWALCSCACRAASCSCARVACCTNTDAFVPASRSTALLTSLGDGGLPSLRSKARFNATPSFCVNIFRVSCWRPLP
jgi:hypothetical protein